MGGRFPLALSLGLSALCGCRGSTVPSPAGDVATSQAEASRRTGRDLSAPWAPPSSDPGIPGPVAELLRRPLTEENAIRIAILNNRKVRAAYEDLGIARAELVQAGLLANPVFGAHATLMHEGAEIELGISKSLLDVFLRPMRQVRGGSRAGRGRGLRRPDARPAGRRRPAGLRPGPGGRTGRGPPARRGRLGRRVARPDAEAARRGNETDPRLTTEEIAAERAVSERDDAASAVRLAREPMNVLLGLSRGPRSTGPSRASSRRRWTPSRPRPTSRRARSPRASTASRRRRASSPRPVWRGSCAVGAGSPCSTWASTPCGTRPTARGASDPR